MVITINVDDGAWQFNTMQITQRRFRLDHQRKTETGHHGDVAAMVYQLICNSQTSNVWRSGKHFRTTFLYQHVGSYVTRKMLNPDFLFSLSAKIYQA